MGGGGAWKRYEEELHLHPVRHRSDMEGMVSDLGESSDQEGTVMLCCW